MLIESWRIDIWIPSFFLKLPEQNGASSWNVTAGHKINGLPPIGVPGKGSCSFGITPSCRFSNNCGLNSRCSGLKSLQEALRRHQPIVVKIFVNPIRNHHAEFRICGELLKQVLRIEILKLISSRKRSCSIFTNIQESVLSIMNKKFKSLSTDPTSDPIKIVWPSITQEI